MEAHLLDSSEYIRNIRVLKQTEVAQAFTYVLQHELDEINKIWIDADEESYLTLQGKAQQLRRLLLIVAPDGRDKQKEE
jgi:hypothetical protein